MQKIPLSLREHLLPLPHHSLHSMRALPTPRKPTLAFLNRVDRRIQPEAIRVPDDFVAIANSLAQLYHPSR